MSNEFSLALPNRELLNIYAEQILIIFKKQISKNGVALKTFYTSLTAGNPQEVEQQFTAYAEKIISVRDTFVRKPTKENFYRGILLCMLGFKPGWAVASNRKSGNGLQTL